MSQENFNTARGAGVAFYGAIESSDVEGIMRTWADDDSIVCIHPLGPALTGRAAIRDSWQTICRPGQTLSFNVVDIHYEESAGLAFHVVREEITMVGSSKKYAAMIATNVYRHTEQGWRMVLHQASPGPAPESTSDDVVLH
jgi:ketosteroid isomerase-like protein